MKNKVLSKILVCLFIFLVFFMNGAGVVEARSNQQYNSGYTYQVDNDGQNLLSVITKLVMPVVFPIFNTIEDTTSVIMMIFTGNYFFPWADKIIFNTIPFLDVNFINPQPGSLFLKGDGVTFTSVGNVIRSTYFTILTICLGFLGIGVAVNVIKMLCSSLASSKARYKEAINATILTLILLFGMHYLISFVFYLNEQMVEIASKVTLQIVNPDTIVTANEQLQKAEDENNKKLVENFYSSADVTSPSPITVAKKVLKEAANAIDKTIDFLKGIFGSIFGDDDDKKVDASSSEVRQIYEDLFPSKDDVIKTLNGYGTQGINVAAFLLKDYTYRDLYLWPVAGNDSNSFSKGGFMGLLTSFSNTVLWASGVLDTGLIGLKNLCESTHYITQTMKANNAITSRTDYNNKTAQLAKIVHDNTKSDKEKNTARIMKVYYDAYWKYVYEGNDKEGSTITGFFSSMGRYFLEQSYYTNIKKGDWSPKTFSAIPSILYCMFVLQSFMFLFSYIKRFFYVVILALLGPIVVVYDYIMKSY